MSARRILLIALGALGLVVAIIAARSQAITSVLALNGGDAPSAYANAVRAGDWRDNFTEKKTGALIDSTNPSTLKFPTGKFIRNDLVNAGLQFNPDGSWIAFDNSTQLATGTYQVEGDVYTEVTNDQNCPVPMQYMFTFDGNILQFLPLQDPAKDDCRGRADGFSSAVSYHLAK